MSRIAVLRRPAAVNPGATNVALVNPKPPSPKPEPAADDNLSANSDVVGRHHRVEEPPIDDNSPAIVDELSEVEPPRSVIGGWVPETVMRAGGDEGAWADADDVDDADGDDLESEGGVDPDGIDPIHRVEPCAVEPHAVGTADAAFADPDLNDVDLDDSDDVEAGEATATRAVRARRIGRGWGRFSELWVPEPLRDARVDPGRRGALILLLVAALAAVATAFGVWRDRPEPRPVETAAIAALAVSSEPLVSGSVLPGAGDGGAPNDGAGGEGVAADSSVAETPAEIVVSVTGLVARPGLVTLPSGARVADAISVAGGAAAEADLTGVNLAAKLADGDSVVVGSSPQPGGSASGVTGAGQNGAAAAGESGPPTAGGLINLNTADEAALDTLPGVGPVMAANILAWRETNGPFSTVEQLQEISGIGPSRFAQISALVTVS